mmetsp:Transcript_40591/g.65992  ORF Transcript_40591/g.65992 Transcript_40591/m.65992 type:complete len:321 (-) Transcript_40591:200-1162(-)
MQNFISKSAALTGSLERPQTNFSHRALSASLNLSSSISQNILICWSEAKQFSYLVIFLSRSMFIFRSPHTSRSISSHVNMPRRANGTTQAIPRRIESICTSNSVRLNLDTAPRYSRQLSQLTRVFFTSLSSPPPPGTAFVPSPAASSTLRPTTFLVSKNCFPTRFSNSSARLSFGTDASARIADATPARSSALLKAVTSIDSTSASVTLSRMISFQTMGGRSRLREFLVRSASPISLPSSSNREMCRGSVDSEFGTHLSRFSPASAFLLGQGTNSGRSRNSSCCSSLQMRWNASRYSPPTSSPPSPRNSTKKARTPWSRR